MLPLNEQLVSVYRQRVTYKQSARSFFFFFLVQHHFPLYDQFHLETASNFLQPFAKQLPTGL